MTGSAVVLRSNALALPLADNSVDLVVTSPPYFALRSYQDAGEHYSGQIGSEATPAEFVDALIAATREMVRVLKPSGSIWVNLGDKYAGSRMDGSSDNGDAGTLNTRKVGGIKQKVVEIASDGQGRVASSGSVRQKSLIGVPWRYALRCIDDLGLILRAEVIWSKPNGLPESVTDRVRRSHEQWFHFTLGPRYYSAVDEIREAHEHPKAIAYNLRNGGPTTGSKYNADRGDAGVSNLGGNPLGKLPGSVWSIPTEPLRVPAELGIDHFAAFPMEWPRRIIQGWSPSGVCTACGEGRRPAVERKPMPTALKSMPHRSGAMLDDSRGDAGRTNSGQEFNRWRAANPETITGYACACPEPTAPTTPSVVLDPFGGTGTSALVAKALGRRGISVDMSADYCRLARWRTTDEGELARALQVKKPEKQIEGQVSMFDLLEDGGAA